MCLACAAALDYFAWWVVDKSEHPINIWIAVLALAAAASWGREGGGGGSVLSKAAACQRVSLSLLRNRTYRHIQHRIAMRRVFV